ncbi:MAG: HAD family phosphatase [Patescibacteria group bacterium]
MQLRAVDLDMDGVLVDSDAISEENIRYICKRHELPVPNEVFASFRGVRYGQVFQAIISQYGHGRLNPDDLAQEAKRRYRDAIRDGTMQLVPGARAFLIELVKRFPSLKVALTTSSSEDVVDMLFEKFDLRQFFDVIVVGGDVKKSKPSPDPYALSFQSLECSPWECIVLEDSPSGVMSARLAGCRNVVGITTTTSQVALLNAGAHAIVDRHAEVFRLLRT